ncbi:tetratricopeptide repeat protein [Brumimicrobium aurantiacum]|uniref:Tetratricopeptide repeat protein n=1 Tax=Brumimicrobium aurantiacum TaxID=1737063 RepID=A0A3E1F1F9_9FLAO|nr:tetratricopeptide repeat protein [Brumimicrobium aurantiacum]RFC55640.1 tetratricopeptide repeat protein [Brumimicrobium aurantiacum]
MMKLLPILLFLSLSIALIAQHKDETDINEEALSKPLVERFILDEIKSLRQENQSLRTQVTEQIAEAKLESSDRAVDYTTSTINNIFYIITAGASLLVLLGWRSLNDIKKSLKIDMSRKVDNLTNDYESRLKNIETKMAERSKTIIETQQDITNTNSIHSLWMRVGLEKSEEEKITMYDEILNINPSDIEAMAYKADALLEIGEVRWALNLSNTAIGLDDEYAQAYWQRACAYARLDNKAEAVRDIKKALELSDALESELLTEKHFDNLHDYKSFKELTAHLGESN